MKKEIVIQLCWILTSCLIFSSPLPGNSARAECSIHKVCRNCGVTTKNKQCLTKTMCSKFECLSVLWNAPDVRMVMYTDNSLECTVLLPCNTRFFTWIKTGSSVYERICSEKISKPQDHQTRLRKKRTPTLAVTDSKTLSATNTTIESDSKTSTASNTTIESDSKTLTAANTTTETDSKISTALDSSTTAMHSSTTPTTTSPTTSANATTTTTAMSTSTTPATTSTTTSANATTATTAMPTSTTPATYPTTSANATTATTAMPTSTTPATTSPTTSANATTTTTAMPTSSTPATTSPMTSANATTATTAMPTSTTPATTSPTTSANATTTTTAMPTSTTPATTSPMTSANATTSTTTMTTPTSSATTSVSVGPTTGTTGAPTGPHKIYIMACICVVQKSFTNMSEDTIIKRLISDTQIDERETTLSQSRLISKPDSRSSSKVVGTIGIVVLVTVFGSLLCCDLLSITKTKRKVHSKK